MPSLMFFYYLNHGLELIFLFCPAVVGELLDESHGALCCIVCHHLRGDTRLSSSICFRVCPSSRSESSNEESISRLCSSLFVVLVKNSDRPFFTISLRSIAVAGLAILYPQQCSCGGPFHTSLGLAPHRRIMRIQQSPQIPEAAR